MTFHDFEMKTIDGRSRSLGAYKGRAVLVVNTASECGYTPQYAGLEQLYAAYKDKGFAVAAFPSNDFGAQEPGSDAEIKTFCERTYKTTFDLYSKIPVKGGAAHPLYKFLTSQPGASGEIAWNFTKFLIDPEGRVVGRYASKVTPQAPELIAKLESVLPAKASGSATLTDARRIEIARGYAEANAAKDYAKARSFLAPNARVWYEKREGDGEPLEPGSGTWGHWDTYFHGRTAYSDWRVKDGVVVVTANETNDFYRLLDWKPWPMHFSYWIDGEGKVAGFMVQAQRGTGSTGSRLDDAKAWVKTRHPEELAHLMPEDRIDPTGDRAERWRKLLVEWRKDAGLPAVTLAN